LRKLGEEKSEEHNEEKDKKRKEGRALGNRLHFQLMFNIFGEQLLLINFVYTKLLWLCPMKGKDLEGVRGGKIGAEGASGVRGEAVAIGCRRLDIGEIDGAHRGA